MSYLLDTNVLSELVRKAPSPAVVRWFQETPEDALHVSVLTVGEIRQGVERLPAGARRERLRIADRWGRLVAQVRRPVPAIDSLLAATALHHGLRLVTRNVADFAFPDLETVDPWGA